MRLRSRPLLFARVFVDAVVTRPLLRALVEHKQSPEPTPVIAAETVANPPLLRAA